MGPVKLKPENEVTERDKATSVLLQYFIKEFNKQLSVPTKTKETSVVSTKIATAYLRSGKARIPYEQRVAVSPYDFQADRRDAQDAFLTFLGFINRLRQEQRHRKLTAIKSKSPSRRTRSRKTPLPLKAFGYFPYNKLDI